ncbi:MAG: primosomal protein N' [Elusimicrobia bacterium]|nr:primosomal protein N' [Elusimicrobiota bacterium]
MLIAEVAFPVPVHNTYHYLVPEGFAPLEPGTRVRASFGPRLAVGTVLAVFEGSPQRQLKPLHAVLDPGPVLSAELLECARWMSRRYGAAVGECVKAVLPSFVRSVPAKEGRAGALRPPPTYALTDGQRQALEGLLESIRSRRHGVAVLFGVPASGKTEVYLRLIEEAVKDGGQALFMLPEISLTGPFFEEFSGRLREPVALWHSRRTMSQRRETWSGLARGEVRIVVGARSAVLLPFRSLRLAVLDEEQDESFKQESPSPGYHAREVALHRARAHGSLVVLGSATPSLETWRAAQEGRATLFVMPERVCCKEMPAVSVVPTPQGHDCVSAHLLAKLKDRLGRGEQSILLVNRRGFSTLVLCRKCGWVDRCPACGVARIRHQEPDGAFLMRCHRCGRRTPVAAACGVCKEPTLWITGTGTQKVVSELKRAIPGVRVLRMDRDILKESAADRRIIEDFKAGRADVLVGTKLVAKSFHFPEVTLVGVVDADTMIHMPDFRASERTMQLLSQVAGRSGRGEKPGEVVVQTMHPGLAAMSSSQLGRYELFAAAELAVRKELSYPPFAELIRVELAGRAEKIVEGASQEMADRLGGILDAAGHQVLGPAPSIPPVYRGRHRRHILVKVLDPAGTESALDAIRAVRVPAGVKAGVVVDPYDLA